MENKNRNNETKEEKMEIELKLIDKKTDGLSFELEYHIQSKDPSYFDDWELFVNWKSENNEEDTELYLSKEDEYKCEHSNDLYFKIYNDPSGKLFAQIVIENTNQLFKSIKRIEKILSEYKVWKNKNDKTYNDIPDNVSIKI